MAYVVGVDARRVMAGGHLDHGGRTRVSATGRYATDAAGGATAIDRYDPLRYSSGALVGCRAP